jgi:methionyl-tRNA formyltransferase
MDAGAGLARSRVEIGELETAGELHDRLADDGAPLLLEVLNQLAAGKAVETEQDHAAATIAPKLNRDATRLDWTAPAAEIARKIRGLFPWPGCRVRILDQDGQPRDTVTLVRARVGPRVTGEPGRIAESRTIAAGDRRGVEIIELQPEGKRPMPLAAYRNGHPWEPGTRLESV